jgi:hypothetical protein
VHVGSVPQATYGGRRDGHVTSGGTTWSRCVLRSRRLCVGGRVWTAKGAKGREIRESSWVGRSTLKRG